VQKAGASWKKYRYFDLHCNFRNLIEIQMQKSWTLYEKYSNGGDLKIVLLSLYVFLVCLFSSSLFFCLNWIIKGLEFIEWCSRLK
jgi:hypothetical protein